MLDTLLSFWPKGLGTKKKDSLVRVGEAGVYFLFILNHVQSIQDEQRITYKNEIK